MAMLYRWATNEDKTLCTYATGILASAAEQQDINSQYTTENNTLVIILFCFIIATIEKSKT